MALDVTEFKQRQRKVWSTGDFPDVATRIVSASEELVAACDVQSGQDVLDVATGTANAAILAAQRGARVTGIDLTPELFDAARRRIGEAGLEIELIEGDAEDLPFPADSFDRVLSVFGVMFVPRHAQGAAELVRVCRPGGMIGVTAWTPEGSTGQMFRILAGHMPPPPPELKPPMMWGSEDYVRDLFAGSGAELEFHRRIVRFEYESVDWALEYNERVLGPILMTKAALEPQGEWEPVREELRDMFDRGSHRTAGGVVFEGEFLLTVARLPE
jgi:ubiquinone/menaquinone biosynthesis C-methylase UbiE